MIHFIVNPHARSGGAAALWNELEKLPVMKNTDYTVHYTEYAGHAVRIADELSHAASKSNPILIGIFGGDGTVNEVYNGINTNHRYITLGYIPTGSGNDYARGLNIPRDTAKALNKFLAQTSGKAVEHGIVTSASVPRKFAVSCGIGYDADIIYRVSNSKFKKFLNKLKLGKLVYTLIGIIQVFICPKLSAHIVIDENTIIDTDSLYFASVHILKYEGGGWQFAPHANPSDGMLSACLFYGTGRLSFALNLISCIFNRHEGRKGVSLYNCRSINISISSDTDTHSHTDGECLGKTNNLSASICSSDQFINVIY